MCNMKKVIFVYLIPLLLLSHEIHAKKTKKIKRPKEDFDSTTPQADVVTHSSFGYTDVGAQTYDGFVPSSPDYASYLSSFNQESTTKLYAPAFPTSMDTTGPDGYNNYDSQMQEGQNYASINGQTGAGTLQFQQNPFNLGDSSSFTQSHNLQMSNLASDSYYNNIDVDDTAPVYGTKLSSRHKNKILSQFNNTRHTFDILSPTSIADKTPSFQSSATENEPPSSLYDTDNNNNQNIYNYAPTYPPTTYNDYQAKPTTTPVSFQKVVDFTKYKFPYPSELEHKYAPDGKYSIIKDEDIFANTFKYNQGNYNAQTSHQEINYGNEENLLQKPYNFQEFSPNQIEYSKDNYKQHEMINSFKDKVKNKLFTSPGNNPDYSSWKSPVKSSHSFKVNSNDKPLEHNENGFIDTASSSNTIDITKYRFPKTYSVSNHQKYPQNSNLQTQSPTEFHNEWQNFENLAPNYLQDYKHKNTHMQSSNSPMSTSYWGNNFKTYSSPPSFKNTYRKPQILEEENDEVVHIPKKSRNKYNNKYQDSKPINDWKGKTKPNNIRFSSGKPIDEWNKEVATRFKSEEDLLGLRTQDTSHPSYLPTFKFNNEEDEYKSYPSNFDYKGAIENWRQSYLKSKKVKNWNNNDYDGMETDTHPIHVPIPKPYKVEVPHPVIVPVPQPYPVRVPVPKPVAVPVVRELSVQVEKPVPYPVIKKVPYPVEKPVPVPVEKPVPVPVEKPYPVPIPHVRPVFHHSRYPRDEGELSGDPGDHDFDDDYYPSRHRNPDSRGPKRILIRTKNKSSRSRRPAYQERSRRRWPPRRPTSARVPYRSQRPTRQHYRDDPENLDHEHNDYYDYCRRNGNCK